MKSIAGGTGTFCILLIPNKVKRQCFTGNLFSDRPRTGLFPSGFLHIFALSELDLAAPEMKKKLDRHVVSRMLDAGPRPRSLRLQRCAGAGAAAADDRRRRIAARNTMASGR